jgi:MoxR-like ATPase
MDYLLDLVRATRENPDIRLGLSSRGGLHLKRAMQAIALLNERDYVIPEDLRKVFLPVTLHRVLLSTASGDGRARDSKKHILQEILSSVLAPV